jgi:hypothetical protein
MGGGDSGEMSEMTGRLSAALADRYAIERELGQGGMATVYLAHDVRHDRPVALKVLRAELAAVIGAQRFLTEIKTTANLQHPHILPLFDSGEANGFLYYVMPYVEGESLRDRLTREKQLPVDEAVRIAAEVAGALDYAHRHGVVHRDIKPENILLHEGRALVADFGIALAVSRSEGATRMTETGMSLGTPHYMSPEQAMGEKEITPKADVYALGCVLYEMLAGEPPFTGPTAQAVVARVMTEQPRSLTLQRRTVAAHVEAAVLCALEKLPADRFATAAQFAEALAGQGPALPATRAAAAAGHRREGRGRLARLQLPLVALAGVALGALAWSVLRPAPQAPVTRYGLALPPSQAPDPAFRAIPSPDGSRIAYVGPAQGGTQLWVKARDAYGAAPLAGTLGVTNFTWSPDGSWIAFTLGTQVKKISVVGGAAILLADTASNNPGLAWLDDGTIVYIQAGATRLRRVPEAGGPSTVVLTDSAALLFPTPLPGGRGVLFTRCSGSCLIAQDIWVLDLRSGAAHRVLVGAALGQYTATGHVVYVRPDGGLFAVPFDLGSLKARGSPIPVMDSVAVVNGIVPLAAVSRSGTLVMRAGAALSMLQRYQMMWVARDGRETPVDSTWTFRLTAYGANVGWVLSPDGTRLAIGLATDAGDDIWVKQLPRGPLSRVSYDSAAEYRPRWTPDGRSLMFGSNRLGRGAGGLYERHADGTGADSLILRAAGGIFEAAWSPDRRWLLFRTGGTMGQGGGRDIVGIRPGVDSSPVPLVATPFDEEAIALSPDGRWLAYESDETGRTEVFIRPFPNTNSAKWQVSNGGGMAPLWAKNGRELFYVNGNRDMTAVTVGPGAEPRLGERHVLFHLRAELYLAAHDYYTPFDVAPDGRFIMAQNAASASSLQVPLIVVDNWFAELRARLRSGR